MELTPVLLLLPSHLSLSTRQALHYIFPLMTVTNYITNKHDESNMMQSPPKNGGPEIT